MTSVIKLKRSETASSVPTTSDLAVGEVAVNTADQKIYMRSSSGIVTVANNSTSSGGGIALTDISVGAEGTASGDGDLSYNNSTGVFTYTPPTLSGITGNTDDITEGSTNLYFTDARIDAHLNTSSASANQVLSWDGSDYAWVAQSGGGSGSTNVIAPVAFAFVNTTSNGSGTGIGWGNWNSSNSTLDFTFTTAQSDANYIVVTDSETFDDYYVGITNKTTTGFRAEFYDSSGSRSPSSFSPFTFMIYASTPTVAVSGGGGDAFKTISVNGQSDVVADSSTDTLTLVAAGLNSITTDASTDTITIGTPTGIPFVKEDGTSTSLNLQAEAGTLAQAVASLYIPFTKEDGTSVTTLVMS